MSFDITSTVTELKNLTQELERMNKEALKLRKRKKELETVLEKFLEEKKQPGFKYKNIAVVSKETSRLLQKPKDERLKDAIDILRSQGVPNPDKVYEELMKSQKKDTVKRHVEIKEI